MKKRKIKFLLITLFTLLTLVTACSNDNTEEIENNYQSYEADALVEAYCTGDWDGSFVFNDEHCASIEDGRLWIDCEEQLAIPDMGLYEEPDEVYIVLSQDDKGTWVHDPMIGTIELWKQGTRFKKIVIEPGISTEVYKQEESLVVRYGERIWVYDPEGYEINSLTEIVDIKISGDKILCSDFEHKNFQINGDGQIIVQKTNYVRFPSKMMPLTTIADNIINNAIDTFLKNNEGTLVQEGGFFCKVEDDGTIILNNEAFGHVSLGNERIGAIEDAYNIFIDGIDVFYLDGDEYIHYCCGREIERIDLPNGAAEFISQSVIKIYTHGDERAAICIIRDDGTVQMVSQKALDCQQAGDTLYYMEGDAVYALEWQDPSAEAHLFIEGAYALSPFGGESRGALVSQEKANWEGYGYSNIYSPYGE